VPKRIYEFVCPEGHITEKLTDSEVRHSVCPKCFHESERIVSTPQIRLDGCSGHFPGAYDKWERIRAEKLAVERKQKASRGED
jgi:NMD protein affecting ribosome stability and mRNA decay